MQIYLIFFLQGHYFLDIQYHTCVFIYGKPCSARPRLVSKNCPSRIFQIARHSRRRSSPWRATGLSPRCSPIIKQAPVRLHASYYYTARVSQTVVVYT